MNKNYDKSAKAHYSPMYVECVRCKDKTYWHTGMPQGMPDYDGEIWWRTCFKGLNEAYDELRKNYKESYDEEKEPRNRSATDWERCCFYKPEKER